MVQAFCSVEKIHLIVNKKVCVINYFSSMLNFDTFSGAPSIIIDNFLWMCCSIVFSVFVWGQASHFRTTLLVNGIMYFSHRGRHLKGNQIKYPIPKEKESFAYLFSGALYNILKCEKNVPLFRKHILHIGDDISLKISNVSWCLQFNHTRDSIKKLIKCKLLFLLFLIKNCNL